MRSDGRDSGGRPRPVSVKAALDISLESSTISVPVSELYYEVIGNTSGRRGEPTKGFDQWEGSRVS